MSSPERRNSIALDDAFSYCRQLETKTEEPELYKVCNAVRTLDRALAAREDSPIPVSLCAEAWSRVRDGLFNILISSFAGRIEVFTADGTPVEPGDAWPQFGSVSFYPDQISRRNDSFDSRLDHLSRSVSNVLRWRFADGLDQIEPCDFETADEETIEDDFSEEAKELLDRLYEICEEQAAEGKKKAHRKWWQLYWEATSCPNKRQRHQLEKQMVALEGIWGKPED